MYILGFDIGGTKCSVVTAYVENEKIRLLKKEVLSTDLEISAYEMIDRLMDTADRLLVHTPDKIGISCGGPLDARQGVILSPPNLLGWEHIEIVKRIKERYGVAVRLQNDANASALAEWKFGAGIGCKNMIFLTFGTGLGAGLILNGTLYEGTNGNAGEVGHIRLAEEGPVGYKKAGSFEGFCSGGGIARLGYIKAMESIRSGKYPLYFKDGMSKTDISAKSIADAAEKGDPTACEVYKVSGKFLGRGLSILIDILNPEKIVIGSIFARSGALLAKGMEEELKKEALPLSLGCCRVESAKLSENLGDYAAVATALI